MKLQNKLLVLFLSFFLLGADSGEMVSYPPQKIMGFRGLDTRSTAPMIADSRARSLKNVKLSSALDLRQRYGMDTVNDATLDDYDLSSPAITGIFDSEFSNGNSWTLAFLGNKIKYDNSGTWTEIGHSYTSPTITSSDNYLWQCLMAYDSAVCTNDINVLIKIDSTPTKSALDVSDLSDTLTKAKAIYWFRNYLILGNTYENSIERPTRFRWSNVGEIETFSDDDFSDISTFAGDEIIGFSEMYGDLYIFLKKAIWRASLVGGDDVFVFKKVVDGIGAVSRDSIKSVQLSDSRSATMFLDSRKKVLMFDGATVVDVGANIQETLDDINEARLPYAVATFDGKSYYLSVSTGSYTTNDTVYDLQTEIFEWTLHTRMNINAFAQVTDSDGAIKTYCGNYDSFIYWMDNPSLKNDVDGAVGIVDSVGLTNTDTDTGLQVLLDANLTEGDYTGAIVRITSGTGAGEEQIIIDQMDGDTGIVVATAFTTTPDSTSVFSIGDIDAEYQAKFYDMGESAKEKTFLGMLFWAEEASDNNVDISYAIDYDFDIESETVSLSPATASLWDSAIWDTSVWGTTGDKIYTIKMSGFGNTISPSFANDNIDESFHLYGFNLIGTVQDIKQ